MVLVKMLVEVGGADASVQDRCAQRVCVLVEVWGAGCCLRVCGTGVNAGGGGLPVKCCSANIA